MYSAARKSAFAPRPTIPISGPNTMVFGNPSAPAFGPSPKNAYAPPFHSAWLTLETTIEPDIDRMEPQMAPMIAAFRMKITTPSEGSTYPVARVAYDRCHSANAALVANSTRPELTPAAAKRRPQPAAKERLFRQKRADHGGDGDDREIRRGFAPARAVGVHASENNCDANDGAENERRIQCGKAVVARPAPGKPMSRRASRSTNHNAAVSGRSGRALNTVKPLASSEAVTPTATATPATGSTKRAFIGKPTAAKSVLFRRPVARFSTTRSPPDNFSRGAPPKERSWRHSLRPRSGTAVDFTLQPYASSRPNSVRNCLIDAARLDCGSGHPIPGKAGSVSRESCATSATA